MGLAAVLIISALYPNNLKFPFAFDLNQPWRYADLEAPYDIPVLKTDDALEADRQEVLLKANPVYRYDPEVARRARSRFLEDFRLALDSAKANKNYPGLLAQPENHGARSQHRLRDQHRGDEQLGSSGEGVETRQAHQWKEAKKNRPKSMARPQETSTQPRRLGGPAEKFLLTIAAS